MKWSVKAQVSQDWLLYKFHNYTSFTTIQVSQIHRSHNYTQVSQGWLRSGEALLVLNATKACALCNWCLFHRCIGALPMKWNLSNFTGFPLCSNTDPGLFVGSRDYWISCRAAENFEEIKYLLVSVWDTIFPQYTKCLQSWKVKNTAKHALHMFSKDLGIMDWAFLHAILWVKVSQSTSSNQDWLRMVALFETHPTRLVTHLTIILWPMSGHIIAWSCQLYKVWSNSSKKTQTWWVALFGDFDNSAGDCNSN